MAAHTGLLAWIIPWTEGPEGLQSMGLYKVYFYLLYVCCKKQTVVETDHSWFQLPTVSCKKNQVYLKGKVLHVATLGVHSCFWFFFALSYPSFYALLRICNSCRATALYFVFFNITSSIL